MSNQDSNLARAKADIDRVQAECVRQWGEEMARIERGESRPDGAPGIEAWLPDTWPAFGVDRSGPSFLDRPALPAPPRSVWARLRDAWAGMVSGWKGEVGDG